MLADWINIIVQGVLLGGLYALFAAGLSISFGVMRMLNIAHGDMIIFASYATIVGASYLKLPMVLTVVLVTHDLDTLAQMATSVAVLAERRIVSHASLDETLALDHPFVARFFRGLQARRSRSNGAGAG